MSVTRPGLVPGNKSEMMESATSRASCGGMERVQDRPLDRLRVAAHQKVDGSKMHPHAFNGAPSRRKFPTTAGYEFPLQSRAEALHAQGNMQASLESALAAGKRIADHFTTAGDCNQTVMPCRSQAALSLHALGKEADACKLAQE